MGRWVVSALALLQLALMALAATPSFAAADAKAFAPLYGNWQLVWDTKTGTRTGVASFTDRGAAGIHWSDGGLDYFETLVVEGGAIRGASVDGKFELQLDDGATAASGKWHDRPTTWRRVIEQVDHVEVLPGRGGTLDYPTLAAKWEGETSAGGLPTVKLVITGSGLPWQTGDAGMVSFDAPGFDIPRLSRFADSAGTWIEIEVALNNPPTGRTIFRLNNRPFEFSLELGNAPTACTGLTLTPASATLLAGRTIDLATRFTPEGCTAYVRGRAWSDVWIAYTSSNGAVADFSGGKTHEDRVPRFATGFGLSILAHAGGDSEIRAAYGTLAATTTLHVDEREACRQMQIAPSRETVLVGASITIRTPTLNDAGNADYVNGGDALQPPGCTLGSRLDGTLALDRPDLARLDGNTLTGLKPGVVIVGYTLGPLGARTEVAVVAQPPCDTIGFGYGTRKLRVGGVIGLASDGGMWLSYTRADAPKGWESACAKPAAGPTFESLNPPARADRTTGAVTGISLGGARIAVVHGELHNTTRIEVVDGAACTTLALGYRDSLDPGVVAKPYPDYQPSGCVPPVGAASFAAVPAGGVVLLFPDGLATALAPGKATVTMQHGGLSASEELTVGAFADCRTMSARFDPAQVVRGEVSRLILSYSPDPCRPPEGDADALGYGLTGADAENGSARLFYAIYSNDEFWSGTGFAWVKHGPLRAEAFLSIGHEPCVIDDAVVAPPVIHPGETARLVVRTTPPNCWTGAVSPYGPQVLVERRGRDTLVTGVEGGTTELDVFSTNDIGRSRRASVTVEAPACKTLEVSYYPNPLNPTRTLTLPELDYWPRGCTRPAGAPRFASSDPAVLKQTAQLPPGDARHAFAAPFGSEIPGAFVLRPILLKERRMVRITVTHGDLGTAVAIGLDTEL